MNEVGQKLASQVSQGVAAGWLANYSREQELQADQLGATVGRHFFHEELGIALTAPQGWQVQNTQQALVIANAARPWVLKTVAYPPGGFAELARSSPLPRQAEAQLRLLNSAYAGGAEPRPGQPVKVVR